MIFDTHTHAYFEGLSEREDDVLSKMSEMDVVLAVQIGCDQKSSRKAVELAKRHPERYRATVGLHPEEAQHLSREAVLEEISAIRKLLEDHRATVVAIGETGWDFFRLSEDSETRERELASQRLAFESQVALAKEFDLPLVIHTRNSGQALLESVKEFGIDRAVVHCFSEDLDFARKAMELSKGIMFGFSGILTYKSAKNVHEAAKEIPLDRILVETDAPFLAPEPVRGTVNESGNTRHVLERLKTFRGESGDEVERAVFANSLRFYAMEYPNT